MRSCHRMYFLIMPRAGRAGHGASQLPATLVDDVLVIFVDQMCVGDHARVVNDLIQVDPEIRKTAEALCQRMRQTNKSNFAGLSCLPPSLLVCLTNACRKERYYQ